jgi:SAM-dependent methyltransferase
MYKINIASLKRLLKQIYHYGRRYRCPNCGSSLRRWALCGVDTRVAVEKQIIGAGRRESECPVCRSAERDRLVYLYLRDHLHLFDDKEAIDILHIAPEDCLYLPLHKKIKYHTYLCGDKFEPGYHYGRQVQRLDLTALDLPDHSFDLILCNHVLEHIPDDRQAMRELYRVLKPRGRAILQVPLSPLLRETFEDFSVSDPLERERLFGQKNHCRIYGQDYGSRLEAVGFAFRPVFLSDSKYRKYGLDWREAVLVVEK